MDEWDEVQRWSSGPGQQWPSNGTDQNTSAVVTVMKRVLRFNPSLRSRDLVLTPHSRTGFEHYKYHYPCPFSSLSVVQCQVCLSGVSSFTPSVGFSPVVQTSADTVSCSLSLTVGVNVSVNGCRWMSEWMISRQSGAEQSAPSQWHLVNISNRPL